MSTTRNGNTAEARILAAFESRGYHVLVPFGDGQPYDLVVHIPEPSAMVRVQCKNAWQRGECLTFNSRTTDHGHGPRPYVGVADTFAVFFAPSQTVYVVPVKELPGYEGRLRLEPTRNNQRRRVRMASEYELDRWSSERLAQTVDPS